MKLYTQLKLSFFGQILTAVILKQCFGSDQNYDFISFWVSTRSHMTLLIDMEEGWEQEVLSAAFPDLRLQKEMMKDSHTI